MRIALWVADKTKRFPPALILQISSVNTTAANAIVINADVPRDIVSEEKVQTTKTRQHG